MLGVAFTERFHDGNKLLRDFGVAAYYFLLQRLIEKHNPVIIRSQEDYDENKHRLSSIYIGNPGFHAPDIRFDKSLGATIVAQVADLHAGQSERIPAYIEQNGIQHLLVAYWQPTMERMRIPACCHPSHFPWFCDERALPSEVVYRGQPKVRVCGETRHDFYSTRRCVAELPYVAYFDFRRAGPRLGYEEYYEWLNRCDTMIAATSPSCQYAIGKYFEAAGAGCLLFAERCPDLAMLGFSDDNCVMFDQEDFEEQAKRYLSQPESYLDKRHAGIELIRSRHLTTHRLDTLEQVLGLKRDVVKVRSEGEMKKLDKPKVTVVIPCYNHAHFLHRSIESVLAQTEKDIEIVVVNDGSKDDCSEVVRALAAEHPECPIHLVEQENKGLAGARNAGFKKANAEFVFPFDADDYIEPDVLEACYRVAVEKEADVVYTDVRTLSDGKLNKMKFSREALIQHNCFVASCLIRKTMWEWCGGYNEKMREGYEDWDFWMSCFERGAKFRKSEGKGLFVYDNQDKSSMVYRAYNKHDELYAQLKKRHPCLFPLMRRKDEAPRVTVVIPVYMQGRFLYRSIGSVLKQTYKRYEIVVVNDGSPDRCSHIVKNMQKCVGEGVIRLVEQKNKSLAWARNAGFEAARTPYVLPLDADNALMPTMLEKCVGVMEKDPTVGVVFTDMKLMSGGVFRQFYDIEAFKKRNYIDALALVRKSVWKAVGGYVPMGGLEDWDIWHSCHDHNVKFVKVAEPLFLYDDVRENRLIHSAVNRIELLHERIKRRHPGIYKRHGEKLAEKRAALSLRMLVIGDVYGWTHDFWARGYSRFSRHTVDYTIPEEVDERVCGQYDLLILNTHFNHGGDGWWDWFTKRLPLEKTIRGIHMPTVAERDFTPTRFGGVYAVSREMYNVLTDKYPRYTFAYLRNAVDGTLFTPVSRLGERVGWCGHRDREVKRTHLLKQVAPDVLIKSDWGKQFFVKGRSQEEQVEFYRGLCCYVHPSRIESMSTTVMEAAASALPIVACRIGDNRDIVAKRWLVTTEPDEVCVEEMRKKLAVLRADPELALRVGQDNRRRFEDGGWCWSSRSREYDAYFESVIV